MSSCSPATMTERQLLYRCATVTELLPEPDVDHLSARSLDVAAVQLQRLVSIQSRNEEFPVVATTSTPICRKRDLYTKRKRRPFPVVRSRRYTASRAGRTSANFSADDHTEAVEIIYSLLRYKIRRQRWVNNGLMPVCMRVVGHAVQYV